MPSLATETHVPVYTLEQSSAKGNKQFEIAEHRGFTGQQKNLFFVPHRNAFYKMVFVRQGTSRHWVDMVPCNIKPNTLYFTSPQQIVLKEEATGPSSGVYIYFTEDFLGVEEAGMLKQLSIIQNEYNAHELVLQTNDIIFIEDILAKMLLEFENKLQLQSSMLLAWLKVLLIYISRLYTEQYTKANPAADRELLKKFKALIAENFVDAHEVADYAAMLNLSAGHFSEQIKEQSGKTAIEHIHDRLLLEAKRLLFHTEYPVKEIAYRLGFEEASYFNRFFKRLANTTPLGYRSTIRKMYH
jgi:AraC family transcriptional activator of pobA